MEELLNENQVVDAVAGFLGSVGYKIEQKLHGHERGVDVIARRAEAPARLVYIEAKGGTSTRVGSAKYGKPMGGGEVRINVAEALYTAAVVATRHRAPDEEGLVSAVAFHDDARHRKYVDPLRGALDRLNVGVFWVDSSRSVVLDAPWSL